MTSYFDHEAKQSTLDVVEWNPEPGIVVEHEERCESAADALRRMQELIDGVDSAEGGGMSETPTANSTTAADRVYAQRLTIAKHGIPIEDTQAMTAGEIDELCTALEAAVAHVDARRQNSASPVAGGGRDYFNLWVAIGLLIVVGAVVAMGWRAHHAESLMPAGVEAQP